MAYLSCLSGIFVKWDQKAKRGEPKNEKVCQRVCRVLTLSREFFLGLHESEAKKKIGDRLRVSPSNIDLKSDS